MAADWRRAVALARFVPLGFDDVVAVLRDDALELLSDDPPGDGPARLTLRPGPSAVINCPVVVHVGPLIGDDDVVGLPLWWEASRRSSWFPTLDAGLEVIPRAGGTEMRLIGSYQAPFGTVGAYADGLIGHRLARACLEQFLSEVTDRLTSRCRYPATVPTP